MKEIYISLSDFIKFLLSNQNKWLDRVFIGKIHNSVFACKSTARDHCMAHAFAQVPTKRSHLHHSDVQIIPTGLCVSLAVLSRAPILLIDPRAKSRSFRSSCRAWRVHRLGFHFVLSLFSWHCLGNMTSVARPCEYKVSTVLRSRASDKRVPLAWVHGTRFLPITIASRPHRCRFLKGRLNKTAEWQRAWEIDIREAHFNVHHDDKYQSQSFVQTDCYSGNIYYVRACSNIYARNIHAHYI